ncbi:hypothetical protein HMPREF9946_01374 [Acetobacteraceae bacterium AT-5844]|nr:hypothetical protein HMPREF9946_01374 [Acetobacteraceae bacterium AT-5844]
MIGHGDLLFVSPWRTGSTGARPSGQSLIPPAMEPDAASRTWPPSDASRAPASAASALGGLP